VFIYGQIILRGWSYGLIGLALVQSMQDHEPVCDRMRIAWHYLAWTMSLAFLIYAPIAFNTEGWQYRSISVFPYVGVGEY
jgi:hypothetical protein